MMEFILFIIAMAILSLTVLLYLTPLVIVGFIIYFIVKFLSKPKIDRKEDK